MRCREFERRLELSGGVPDPESAGHLADCAKCRELGDIARASLEPAPPPGPLLDEVLARTGGKACGQAGELLTEWVDGTLRGGESDLVAAHLQGCASCGRLAETLALLANDLPRLAEVEPPAGFTADVMRATLAASAPRRSIAPRWLTQVWTRPRFALEAAYAGAIVIWLMFGAGFAPFRGVPARALEAARTVSVSDLTGGVQPASLGREVWRSTGGRVVDRALESGETLDGFRSAGASFARHGADAIGSALRGDLSGCGMRLKEMGGDLRKIYDGLRRRDTQPNPGSQEA